LLHISKMGGGKRIERVEDVLDLGDDIEVRVDDVDPQGKVSLSPVTALGGGDGGNGDSAPSSGERPDRGDRGERRERSSSPSPSSGAEVVSFEDSFDAELRQEFGDLGPAEVAPSGDRGGDRGRGGRGGGGRGGDRGRGGRGGRR
jgi:polyribonucleotide nucleotidyltransferase